MSSAIDADELIKLRVEAVFERIEAKIWEMMLKRFTLENFRVGIPFSDLVSEKEWDALCTLEGGAEEVTTRIQLPFLRHKYEVKYVSKWEEPGWENFVRTDRPTEIVLTPHSLAEIPD